MQSDINFASCRGQAYDGCSVMAGAYNGLQAKFLHDNEFAIYVHGAAHNLNLVLNDAVQEVLEATEFFETLNAVWSSFLNLKGLKHVMYFITRYV